MTRAPQPCQEIPVEQMSGGALARMRPDLSIGALFPFVLGPRRAATSGWRRTGSLACTCRLGDNAGMARDDSRARLRRLALPLRSGRGQALEDARVGVPCRPRCT